MNTREQIFLAAILAMGNLASAQPVQHPGESYTTISTDGAWCWFSDPRAEYHKGLKDRIYFCSINSRGDVVIKARDNQTKKIETFILHDTLEIDDHKVSGKSTIDVSECTGHVFFAIY